MITEGKNFTAAQTGPLETLLQRDFMGFPEKYFAGSDLGLTGCEVSLNRLPAGKGGWIARSPGNRGSGW